MKVGVYGVVAVALAAVMTAGCANHDTPVEAQATSPAGTAEAAGEAAMTVYVRFWTAVAEAGEIPDPNHPDLARYGAGDAYEKAFKLLLGYRTDGRVSHGAPVLNPQVQGSATGGEPAEVSLTDCVDTRQFLVYEQATGEPVNDEPGGKRSCVAVVERIAGTWKVTGFGIAGLGSC